MRKNIENAFSLMEMMVVLLIVAIIAAATAPMVTKKMMRNAGSGDSPWVFTGLGNSIAYNMNGSDASAIIGSLNYNNNGGPTRPRLIIASGNDENHPALAFADANGTYSGQINMNATTGVVTMSNAVVGNNSVALGMGQNISGTPTNIVAIGEGTNISGTHNVAIGFESTAADDAVAIGSRMARNTSDQKDRTNATGRGAIAIGQGARSEGTRSIAIGTSNFRSNSYQSPLASDEGAIAIGAGAQAFGVYSVALGAGNGLNTRPKTQAYGNYSVAIGPGARTGINSDNTVAGSVAIGLRAQATARKSVAIGPLNDSINNSRVTSATHRYSTAIGSGAQTTAENQIVLGTDRDTVYIPGHLVVGQNVRLNVQPSSSTWVRSYNSGGDVVSLGTDDYKGGDDNFWLVTKHKIPVGIFSTYYKGVSLSDRRLKNVGEKYTAGLDELKKLDFYHYTFKKDEAKTPMVGVMAQDLQKVFPDAVTKGDDGYLRIRLEDMFYAVINAVKELDNKISEIVADITSIKTTIKSQQETIDSLQKENAELKEEIKSIEKRIEKLEK